MRDIFTVEGLFLQKYVDYFVNEINEIFCRQSIVRFFYNAIDSWIGMKFVQMKYNTECLYISNFKSEKNRWKFSQHSMELIMINGGDSRS